MFCPPVGLSSWFYEPAQFQAAIFTLQEITHTGKQQNSLLYDLTYLDKKITVAGLVIYSHFSVDNGVGVLPMIQSHEKFFNSHLPEWFK